MKVSWKLWLDEFVELDKRMHVEGEDLEGGPAHRYSFLKNVIEAGLGIKNTLQEDNQRTEPRIPICIPVEMSWEGGEWDAFTVNISWGGFMIDEPAPLELGDCLKLKLVMEREGVEFLAEGEVVWVDSEGMGIAFREHEQDQLPALADILHEFIHERMKENLGGEDPFKNIQDGLP